MQSRETSGPDDIPNELLKSLDPLALSWLVLLFNFCWNNKILPKLWLKANVVAVLKPGKEYADVKSYRPISILCPRSNHTNDFILKKIFSHQEGEGAQQARLRPGKLCTRQV